MNTLKLQGRTYQCTATTALDFPPEDQGFTGSAWHGRIDNAIRRHPLLARLLRRSDDNQADRYWIHAPHNRTRNRAADAGPFSSAGYPAGQTFNVTIWLSGDVTTNIESLSLLDATVAAAGQCLPPYSDRAGFIGRYNVDNIATEVISLANLDASYRQAATLTADHAIVQVEFETMLRLGDGRHLVEAQAAFARGQQAIPRLPVLTARIIDRAHTLPLTDNAAWPQWLDELQRTINAHADTLTPVSGDVFPFDCVRLSGHARSLHPIGGLLGHAQYIVPRPALPALSALLTLGGYISVGRKVGLGLGRIRFHWRAAPP